MHEVVKGGKAVELMAVHNIRMKRIDVDNEGDTWTIWWSEHCSCFHWAYNGVFQGIYTDSFINMVPCGIGRPEFKVIGNIHDTPELLSRE
jgi:hypothetical protein